MGFGEGAVLDKPALSEHPTPTIEEVDSSIHALKFKLNLSIFALAKENTSSSVIHSRSIGLAQSKIDDVKLQVSEQTLHDFLCH